MKPIELSPVRVEYGASPVGIGTPRPRLSWRLIDGAVDTITAYEVRLLDPSDQRELATAEIAANETVFVPWPFRPLASRERVAVQVRALSGPARPHPWSRPASCEIGLLEEDDWLAVPISATGLDDVAERPVRFRRAFAANGTLASARLYASALGLYTVEINGVPVGDHVLSPGWTSYRHRVHYDTFDVTSHLNANAANAIGFTVAEGWYRGRFGFQGGVREIYGEQVGPIGQLELTYTDGRREVIATDASWRCGYGPITYSCIYDGERFDARQDDQAWLTAEFDDRDWRPVRVISDVPVRLEAPIGPPVRRVEELRPVRIWDSPDGGHLVDFGQNVAGRLRVDIAGETGTEIVLRHAEVLEDGQLGVRPLRHAAQTDTLTLADGRVTFEPTFTVHGFRYVHATGWPTTPTRDDFVAVVCHSDMERIGEFTCSDDAFSQLHENAVWSMRGNFVDIPTDCPQRDERLGWTGDIQVFAPTASFLYDCNGFLASWLRDVAAEQAELGAVPAYVPWIELDFPPVPAAAWGDAAVIVPWVLYQRFGDRDVLRSQWGSMTAWVDLISDLVDDRLVWDQPFQFGDWLDPSAAPDRPAEVRTDPALVATACHARTLQLVADAAAVLGHHTEADHYQRSADAVRAAFQREFITPAGRVASDSQTAYAIALEFDLLEPTQRDHAGARLRNLVAGANFHIGTGFVGTPLICDALANSGYMDAAYQLLGQRGCPSWLYPITMGATTIWERWDSMLPDGSVNPGDMTSFNHYAYGSVADFLHRRVAGLAPAAPGYRKVDVRPQPGGGLTSVSASHMSPYGPLRSTWQRKHDRFMLELDMPPTVAAVVELPDGTVEHVDGGRHRFDTSCRAADDDPLTPGDSVGLARLLHNAELTAAIIDTVQLNRNVD